MGLFGFILFGITSAFKICAFMSLRKFGNFSTIVALNTRTPRRKNRSQSFPKRRKAKSQHRKGQTEHGVRCLNNSTRQQAIMKQHGQHSEEKQPPVSASVLHQAILINYKYRSSSDMSAKQKSSPLYSFKESQQKICSREKRTKKFMAFRKQEIQYARDNHLW